MSVDEAQVYSPLHCAATRGTHGHCESFLLQRNNVTQCVEDDEKNTPLHLAAMQWSYRHSKISHYLRVCCNPKSRNTNNATVLHLAVHEREFGHSPIPHHLIRTVTQTFQEVSMVELLFICAAEFGHLHIVKYLTDEQGCNPSCFDDTSSTLHFIVLPVRGHFDVVKFLTVEKEL